MNLLNLDLPYVYEKGADQPEPLSLKKQGKFELVDEQEEYTSNKFKRVKQYANGLIVSEEIYSGKEFFKFNQPFVERSKGELFFEWILI